MTDTALRRGRPGYDQRGILEVAVAAFNEHGYDATSIGMIAERLGLSKSAALETVRRFRAHDEATMAKQQAVKDDESKFLQTTRESAEQLLHLFETDAAQPGETAAELRAAKG